MNNYELVFIISPEVPDEELSKAVDKVTALITSKGGSITEVNQWGRKRLAYPIKKYLEGNYVFARFTLPPGAVKEIESTLRVSNEVIRHLVVKTPEAVSA
jgi:small subunit ribosomal protein S6